jgi:hypothetical protein
MLQSASRTGNSGNALLIAFIANRGGNTLTLDSTGEKCVIPEWKQDRKAGAAVWFAGLSPEFQAQIRTDLAPKMAEFLHDQRLRSKRK